MSKIFEWLDKEKSKVFGNEFIKVKVSWNNATIVLWSVVGISCILIYLTTYLYYINVK